MRPLYKPTNLHNLFLEILGGMDNIEFAGIDEDGRTLRLKVHDMTKVREHKAYWFGAVNVASSEMGSVNIRFRNEFNIVKCLDLIDTDRKLEESIHDPKKPKQP